MGDFNSTNNTSGSLVISGNHATLFGLITTGRPGPGGVGVATPAEVSGRRSATGSARRPTLPWTAVPTLTSLDAELALNRESHAMPRSDALIPPTEIASCDASPGSIAAAPWLRLSRSWGWARGCDLLPRERRQGPPRRRSRRPTTRAKPRPRPRPPPLRLPMQPPAPMGARQPRRLRPRPPTRARNSDRETEGDASPGADEEWRFVTVESGADARWMALGTSVHVIVDDERGLEAATAAVRRVPG